MSDFVLDASVALAWVLDNPVPVYALDVRQQLLGSKRGLLPVLWHLEVANGSAMAERRQDLTRADVEDALDQILAAAASKLDTTTDFVPAQDALANARGFHLTAYDAAYLDLARCEELPLATLDKGLRAAATKESRNSAMEMGLARPWQSVQASPAPLCRFAQKGTGRGKNSYYGGLTESEKLV